MIPYSVSKTYAETPDRGLRELSIPCDNPGFTGVDGIHFNIKFNNYYMLAGIPQYFEADAAAGAVYLSFIHGGLGSDGTNNKSNITPSPPTFPAEVDRPAFPNPEVTGYYTAPNPLASDPLKNGFNNTEKQKRSPSDAAAGANNGTVWTATEGRSRLLFSFWAQSGSQPATDMFVLEVYRGMNINDRGAGGWEMGDNPFFSQLIYRYGPVQSVPGPNGYRANMQIIDPIDLPAGCNLFIAIRNISDLASENQLIGSARLVA